MRRWEDGQEGTYLRRWEDGQERGYVPAQRCAVEPPTPMDDRRWAMGDGDGAPRWVDLLHGDGGDERCSSAQLQLPTGISRQAGRQGGQGGRERGRVRGRGSADRGAGTYRKDEVPTPTPYPVHCIAVVALSSPTRNERRYCDGRWSCQTRRSPSSTPAPRRRGHGCVPVQGRRDAPGHDAGRGPRTGNGAQGRRARWGMARLQLGGRGKVGKAGWGGGGRGEAADVMARVRRPRIGLRCEDEHARCVHGAGYGVLAVLCVVVLMMGGDGGGDGRGRGTVEVQGTSCGVCGWCARPGFGIGGTVTGADAC